VVGNEIEVFSASGQGREWSKSSAGCLLSLANSLALTLPVVTIVATSSLPNSTAIADPANGERLARVWCASCHVVAPNQTGASALFRS
jgi:mono/diheme cytochrome c family protein